MAAADPLADWTGAGIGEGVTITGLHARTQPDMAAASLTVWPLGDTVLLWHLFEGWYWCSDLACKVFGWSFAGYIRRTL